MTNTTKLIAELKDLEAKATPGPWDSWLGEIKDESADGFSIGECKNTYDAMLIVAMRNALPDLISEVKQQKKHNERLLTDNCKFLEQRDAANDRAEKAEAANAQCVKTAYEKADAAESIRNLAAQEQQRRMKAEARAEKAEAKYNMFFNMVDAGCPTQELNDSMACQRPEIPCLECWDNKNR